MALAALIVSILALVVAGVTARYNKQNADAADKSSLAADRSADAAKESAEHAKSSAESAAAVARTEAEREHRDLRPTEPDITASLTTATNPRGGHEDRFLEFVLPRTYRISGDAITGGSRSPLSFSPVAEGGKTIKVQLDKSVGPRVDAVHIRFWPPVPGDPGERWHCPCDRDATEGGDPHWSWYIEVPEPHEVWVFRA